MASDRDEIVAAQRLEKLSVELDLLDPAIAVVRHIVAGRAAGEPGAGAAAGQVASFDEPEYAAHVPFTNRAGNLDMELMAGVDRAQIDRAADCRSRRAVNIGGAEVDVDLFDQFRIDLLVREDRVVARIVQRHTVEGQADARRIEAADVERATGRAVSIVVLEADTRDLVDRIEYRLPGAGAGDVFLRQDGLGLGRVRRGNTSNLLRSTRPGDDDVFFHFLRAGRLSEGYCRKGSDPDRERAGCGGQGVMSAHSVEFPMFLD